jgi:nitrilase
MRIAAAQARPAWLDPDATTRVVVDHLQRAATDGVDLLAFPETFLSGYPVWVSRTGGAAFEDAAQKRAYAAYLEAAVTLDGPHVAEVVAAARDLGVFTYLGITERGVAHARGTVFATLLAVDPLRGLVSAHRKLRPTYEERLVWGAGDGHGLRVHEHRSVRVGGLNCWENWMPQARHALYAGGEDVHVSVWPGSSRLTRDITRFVALEGRVYSLAAGALLSMDDIPRDFPLYGELLAAEEEHGPLSYDGGSAIAGPDGEWLVEPVSGKEAIVTAEVDPARVREARQSFDPTGHYARPDVFRVQVDRRRLSAAEFLDS